MQESEHMLPAWLLKEPASSESRKKSDVVKTSEISLLENENLDKTPLPSDLSFDVKSKPVSQALSVIDSHFRAEQTLNSDDADLDDDIELSIPRSNIAVASLSTMPDAAVSDASGIALNVNSETSLIRNVNSIYAGFKRFVKTSLLLLAMLIACLIAGFLFAYLGFTLELFS